MQRVALGSPRVGLFALIVGVLCAGCGPSSHEAGSAVLIMGPFLLGIGVLALLPLVHLWKPVRSEVKPDWPLIGAIGVLVSLMSAIALRTDSIPMPKQLFGQTLWYVGASFATVAMVSWRFVISYEPKHAFFRALAFASAFVLLPAIHQRMSPARELTDVVFFWVLPGYKGIVTAIVASVLLAEAFQKREKGEDPIVMAHTGAGSDSGDDDDEENKGA